MDWTTISDSLFLTSEWQLIDLGEFDLVKLTTLSRPEYTNTISVSGRFEIAQFDSDNSCINLRAIRWESFSLLLELPKPIYFEKNKLGIKLAPDFAPFPIKIEALTMSITNSQNRSSIANAAKERNFASMTADATAIEGLPINLKRRGLIVTNNQTMNIVLGYSNTVSVAAGKNFAVIPPGETYANEIAYTGAIWITTEAGKAVNQPAIELEIT
jgi:hypothetical protein